MTGLPSTGQLAASLAATRAHLDQMRSLAERAHANPRPPVETADKSPVDPALIARDHRPMLPPPERPVESVSPQRAQQVALEGVQMVASAMPAWGQVGDRAITRASSSPAVARAFRSGNPAEVAQVLASIGQMVQQSDATRQMKLNAQTAVGSSGRPPVPTDDAAEWQRIMDASPRRYFE